MPKRGLELSKTQINAYCKKHNFPNPLHNGGLQGSEPQCSVLNGALAKGTGKEKGTGRIILSYSGYRQRLLDPDNFAGGTKFLTDALRYCGAIPSDSDDQITLEFSQKKVATKEQEKTLVTIQYP